jgi:uncharacterized protein YerC
VKTVGRLIRGEQNPHIFLEYQKNGIDLRTRVGYNSHPTKVGDKQVAEIMALHQQGLKYNAISAKVNLSTKTIGSIICNHESGHGPLRITEEKAGEVFELVIKGFVYKTIAAKTGVSMKTIGRIAQGEMFPQFLKAHQAEEKAKVQKLRERASKRAFVIS